MKRRTLLQASAGLLVGSQAQFAAAKASHRRRPAQRTQRAHLALAGNQDALTPVAGLEKIDHELKNASAAAGHPDAWKLVRADGMHFETPAMRAEIHRWPVAKL